MTFSIVMLAYPGMTQLDLTGPFEVFSRLPDTKVELAWKSRSRPIVDASGLSIMASSAFSELSGCDLLFVPGGPGQLELMEHAETLDFLRRMAVRARLITSVSTGSLLLAAAGLLDGYRATCHWLSLDLLALLGAIPVAERVVVDRNRITAAGTTAGIDFALTLARDIAGEEEARRIGLAIEYDPRPPFPPLGEEDPRLVEEVRMRTAVFQERRAAVAKAVGERLLNDPDLP